MKTLEEIEKEIPIMFHRWQDEARHYYQNLNYCDLTFDEYQRNYIARSFIDYKNKQLLFPFVDDAPGEGTSGPRTPSTKPAPGADSNEGDQGFTNYPDYFPTRNF